MLPRSESELREALEASGVGPTGVELGMEYWRLLADENQRQNLTRLIEPAAFYSGHLLDVFELRKFRQTWAGSQAQRWADLGSGGGIPGLLSACLFEDESWVLVESEFRKAEFLARTAENLGLSDRVQVEHARVEKLIRKLDAPVIASKAVGSVEKLYAWLRGGSTWNSLVLFKGPRWEEEWSAFCVGPEGQGLRVAHESRYQTPEGASRVIIRLDRVPRGTSGPGKRG